MNDVFLGIGSNLGDKKSNLEKSIQLIQEKIGCLINRSKFYSTPPLGFKSENNFLNACIQISSELSPYEVLKMTQEIEKQIGRKEKTNNLNYQSRIIDIDLLFYNDLIIKNEDLIIPHPRIQDRKFVLLPLIEIAKDKIHPVNHMTICQILDNCIDESVISVVE